MDLFECAKRVSRFGDVLAEEIKDEAMRLYHSGAVNTDDYSQRENALPKLLVLAAAHKAIAAYSPMLQEDIDSLENLKRF